MSRLIDYLLPFLLTAIVAAVVGFAGGYKWQAGRVERAKAELAAFHHAQAAATAENERRIESAQHEIDEIANEAAIADARKEYELESLRKQLAEVSDRNRPCVSPAARGVLQRARGGDGADQGHRDPPKPAAPDGAAAAAAPTGFVSEAAITDYLLLIEGQWKREAAAKGRLIRLVEELERTKACPIKIVEDE